MKQIGYLETANEANARSSLFELEEICSHFRSSYVRGRDSGKVLTHT